MNNINNELYIVTGAAGNLGSAIVRNLVSKQLPVRAFVLRGEEAARHLPEEAQVTIAYVEDELLLILYGSLSCSQTCDRYAER